LRQDEIDLLKRTVAKGCTEDEFALFLWVCRKHRVDPLTRQIYAVKRWLTKHHKDDRGIWVGGEQMTIQMGIDGYRALAARGHGDFGGCDDAEYKWFEPEKKTPALRRIPESATIRMWKKGLDHPVTATAFWEEFAPADLSEGKADFYNRMPKHMLAKCAESLAIRKGYPDMADIYTNEEMTQHSQDFTPGGRQIVGQDGRAPSGRPVTYEAEHRGALDENAAHAHPAGSEKAKQAEEQLRKVEEEDAKLKSAVPKAAVPQDPIDVKPEQAQQTGPLLKIETVGPDEFIVRGDVQDCYPMVEHFCKFTDGWWRCNLAALKEMQSLQEKFKFRIEVQPIGQTSSGDRAAAAKAEPAPAKAGSPSSSGRKAETASAGSRAAGPSPEPVLVSGVIDRVFSTTTQNKAPMRQVTILFPDKKKPTYGCFDKALFDSLDKAKGAIEAYVTSSGKYQNLVGLKRIVTTEGVRNFDFVDGKSVPVIQNRDREAGSKTLWE
jgi:phage recombination protein Bet